MASESVACAQGTSGGTLPCRAHRRRVRCLHLRRSPVADRDAHAGADSYTYTPAANGHTDRGANGHTDRGANGHADRGANGHADPAANGHADRRAHGHADRGTNSHADRGTNSHADHGSR